MFETTLGNKQDIKEDVLPATTSQGEVTLSLEAYNDLILQLICLRNAIRLKERPEERELHVQLDIDTIKDICKSEIEEYKNKGYRLSEISEIANIVIGFRELTTGEAAHYNQSGLKYDHTYIPRQPLPIPSEHKIVDSQINF